MSWIQESSQFPLYKPVLKVLDALKDSNVDHLTPKMKKSSFESSLVPLSAKRRNGRPVSLEQLVCSVSGSAHSHTLQRISTVVLVIHGGIYAHTGPVKRLNLRRSVILQRLD